MSLLGLEKFYIGVTGIDSQDSAKKVSAIYNNLLPDSSNYQGMSGYLVSLNSMRGNSVSKKFPDVNTLPGMLETTRVSGLNTIHYNTHEPEYLGEQIGNLFIRDNIYNDNLCRAVQINTTWPNLEQLQYLKKQMPALDIILQLNRTILKSNRVDITRKLINYNSLADFVLLDPSGGKGVPFNATEIAPFFRAVRHTLPTKPIILAGGFTPENTSIRLEELKDKLQTKEFGTDAQQGLRTFYGRDDYLDIDKVEQYVKAAVKFFNG